MGRISLGVAAVLVSHVVSCGGEPPTTVPDPVSGDLDFLAAARGGKHKDNDRDRDKDRDRKVDVRIAALVTQDNLVADRAGQDAAVDPDLVNAWGLAFSPQGPAWISSAGRGLLAVYNAAGNALLKVTVPTPPGAQGPAVPTGMAFNGDPLGHLGDLFIACTANGTIVAWQPPNGTTAVLRADSSKRRAVYTGLALATDHGQNRVFAADFRNARVDVFDDAYVPVPPRKGAFVDKDLPRGFAPFNIFARDGLLFVSYAKRDDDGQGDAPGPGNGFIDLFLPDGRFVQRLVSRGALSSPWGMAIREPASRHSKSSPRLLVGNFGDGRINVYELDRDWFGVFRAEHEGALGDRPRHPLVIDGLWSIVFGPDAGGFASQDLFFTAGPDDESHGLFGRLTFR